MTLILGLDPGTATTGYGLVDETPGGDLQAIDYGTIQTPASLTDSERLVILHQRVKEIILLHRPQGCAVEKLFFQKNVRTAIVVGQARGVILLAGAQAGLSIGEYTPSEVKLAVTGYGNADKQQVQEMVKVLLQLDEIPRPDDAADALAIAITHLHSIHPVYQEQQ
jgi:crossover junction endodeoxyribonuclease RuvC